MKLKGSELNQPVTLYDLEQSENRQKEFIKQANDKITQDLAKIDDKVDHIDDELAKHMKRFIYWGTLFIFGGIILWWSGNVLFSTMLNYWQGL